LSNAPFSVRTASEVSLPDGAVARIEGADHFFFGKLFPLGEAVRRWALGWVTA